jgi:hypothetical protein
MSLRAHGARLTTIVLAIVVARAIPSGLVADAAASDPARCAAAKMKAAGKAIYATAKCHQRAMLVGTQAECLANVESKLAAAVAKANLLGSCPGSPDALAADAGGCIDSLAASIATTTTVTSSTTTTTIAAIESCCQGATLCTQVATPADCAPFGNGSAAPAGTVCDATTGACAPPPVAGGPCCQFLGSLCLAGPSLDEANCTTLDGTFFAAGTCTPSGCAP